MDIFSERMEHFILNKISHEKFKPDKNYRFFIVKINRQILDVRLLLKKNLDPNEIIN